MILEEFTENMDNLLRNEKLQDQINKFDIVMLPIFRSEHYYLMCFNLKETRIILIDNSKNGEYAAKYVGIPEKAVSS